MKKVWAAYFSATGTTKKAVKEIAEAAGRHLGISTETFDFSLPAAREGASPDFGIRDLVIFGMPVIAGRVPNLMLKYLDTLTGGGALAVPVVCFGNRDYDDALIELRDILEKDGFHTIAAGAFSCEHSFSTILGAGRPDEQDLVKARAFAEAVAEKAAALSEGAYPEPVSVEGVPAPYRGYYQPRDRKGEPIDIRKVKPVTTEACDECGICAKVCTMGSIDKDHLREVSGICTKCCACVKKCPKGAKVFTDPGYVYHQTELEEMYARRAEPSLFL